VILVPQAAAAGQGSADRWRSAGRQPEPAAVLAASGWQAGVPHPAVARVIVPEQRGTSYGSGTLIDVRGDYGLVLTNWHVVRDGAGTIEVAFPSGYRSAARAIKVDRTWDLAALVIWRPDVDPVRLATQAPSPGEPLTIAGYGQGTYRAATGRCTQYVAPGLNSPYEMVELGVAARQGDSGGPIFNCQGELAGVLFGSGQGTTAGAYCGRVGEFLSTFGPDVGRQPASEIVLIGAIEPLADGGQAPSDPNVDRDEPRMPCINAQGSPSEWAAARPLAADRTRRVATAASFQRASLLGHTRLEQAKSVLAAVGGVSLLLAATRITRAR
jgi:hypothetical protein